MRTALAVVFVALALCTSGCQGQTLQQDLTEVETDLHLAVTDGQEVLDDLAAGAATVEQLDSALAPLLPASGAVGKAQTDLASALAAYHSAPTQATLTSVRTALAALESMSAPKARKAGVTARKKRLVMATPPKPGDGGK
jgi:hypothetical protein